MLSWHETIADFAALARTFFNDGIDETVKIIENADAKTPRTPTLIIRRGPGSIARTPSERSGTFTLLIECWVYNSADFAQANADLDALEQDVISLLNDYVQQVEGDGVKLDLSVNVQPDGDFFRPSVASQLSVEFRWRTRRPMGAI